MTTSALVADIGGTNCRLAIASPGARAPRLQNLKVVPTPRGDLQETLKQYLLESQCGRPDVIAVAAAGRVHHGESGASVALTNAGLMIEQTSLDHFACTRSFLINDLAAVAACIPMLQAADMMPLGQAIAQINGPKLVLGLGTGMGASMLTQAGEVIETEAGHIDLAAVNAEERDLIDAISSGNRLSAEQVLSGPGLVRLHAAISGHADIQIEALLDACMAQDPAAVRSLQVFSRWLGRVAGNLVLSLGAWGGVYFTGGVARGISELLDRKAMREGFEDKAPFGADMRKVATRIIVHDQPALLGLAGLAFPAGPAQMSETN